MSLVSYPTPVSDLDLAPNTDQFMATNFLEVLFLFLNVGVMTRSHDLWDLLPRAAQSHTRHDTQTHSAILMLISHWTLPNPPSIIA